MTSTSEIDSEDEPACQIVWFGQRSLSSNVNVRTHKHTHTHRLLHLDH